MDECMRTLAEPKASYYLVLTGDTATIVNTCNPPLYLRKDRSYELALTNLETYSFIPKHRQ